MLPMPSECHVLPSFPRQTSERRGKFRAEQICGIPMAMNDARPAASRLDALRRAELCSPFLREALRALPDVAHAFERSGAESAVKLALSATDEDLGVELRRQRLGLALSVALGDL